MVVAAAMTQMVMAEGEIKVTDVEAAYSSVSTIKVEEKLAQSLNLGFANTTGNTKTLNLNGKYEMSFTTFGYGGEDLKIAFDTAVFLTKNNGVKNNEEYTANLGMEQYLANGWLGYASINWLRNTFLNYDNKFSIGAGIGKEIYRDGQQSLKLKVGAAYNIEDYSNTQAEKKFTSSNEYLEYNNQLNEVSKFYLKLGSMQNVKDFSNDYEVGMVAGFDFAVAKRISLSMEEEVRYDNLPPVGFKKTDTKSIARVGYHF